MIGLIKEIGLNRFSLWMFHLKHFIEYARLSLDSDYRVKEINLGRDEKSALLRSENSLAHDQHMQGLIMITLGQKKHPEYISTRPVARPKQIKVRLAPVKPKPAKRLTEAAGANGTHCQKCGKVFPKKRTNKKFCSPPAPCKNDFNNHR